MAGELLVRAGHFSLVAGSGARAACSSSIRRRHYHAAIQTPPVCLTVMVPRCYGPWAHLCYDTL